MSIPSSSIELVASPVENVSERLQSLQGLNSQFSLQAWLELQAAQIDGAVAALLALKNDDGVLQPKALWESAEIDLDLLGDITERCLEDSEGLIVELESHTETDTASYALAYPVKTFSESSLNAEIFAVVTFAVEVDSVEAIPAAMESLQWGGAWLEASRLHRNQLLGDQQQSQLGDAVSLLSNVLSQSTFDAAAMRLLSDLVTTLGCEMVSLGYRKKGSIEICHLSHSAQFGKQMNWVRAIEKAMDEAVDQQKSIIYSPGADNTVSSSLVTVAHASLALQQQEENILTLPIFIRQPNGLIDAVGALTLERDIEAPFTESELEYCESIVALAGSALEDKRQNAKPLIIKASDAAKLQQQRLLGPDFWGRKLALSVGLLIACMLVFVDGQYRLSSDAIVEAKFQRVLATPFDGYVDEASVRAGDLVKQGDLIFSLDDRELQLERLRWHSQTTKLSRQYQEAMAAHDRAKINIIAAQLEQAKAQLKLVESKLERADQFAPFDGLIVSGDLSQRLGGAVSKGEPLFELSPLDQYRVELLVKESRIADVQLQQTGSLYLSALPHQSFEIEVDKITPITIPKDGASFFSVEAKIINSHTKLRPGMEGVGKLYIDERNLFGIWTRELMEWLRIFFWTWWA